MCVELGPPCLCPCVCVCVDRLCSPSVYVVRTSLGLGWVTVPRCCASSGTDKVLAYFAVLLFLLVFEECDVVCLGFWSGHVLDCKVSRETRLLRRLLSRVSSWYLSAL